MAGGLGRSRQFLTVLALVIVGLVAVRPAQAAVLADATHITRSGGIAFQQATAPTGAPVSPQVEPEGDPSVASRVVSFFMLLLPIGIAAALLYARRKGKVGATAADGGSGLPADLRLVPGEVVMIHEAAYRYQETKTSLSARFDMSCLIVTNRRLYFGQRCADGLFHSYPARVRTPFNRETMGLPDLNLPLGLIREVRKEIGGSALSARVITVELYDGSSQHFAVRDTDGVVERLRSLIEHVPHVAPHDAPAPTA